MFPHDVLSTIEFVLTVGFGLGGASAYFRSSRAKAVIDIQGREIAALTESNNRLEKDNAAFKAQVDQQTETIVNLREVAQQTPALVKLIATSGKQHQEIMDSLASILKVVTKRK